MFIFSEAYPSGEHAIRVLRAMQYAIVNHHQKKELLLYHIRAISKIARALTHQYTQHEQDTCANDSIRRHEV